MEQDLSMLTPLQQQVYLLKEEQKKSLQAVAQELGLSMDVARRVYQRARRRLWEWESHCQDDQNNIPMECPLTRGELELLISALRVQERWLLGRYRCMSAGAIDPLGAIGITAVLIPDLLERLQMELYGEIRFPSHLKYDADGKVPQIIGPY